LLAYFCGTIADNLVRRTATNLVLRSPVFHSSSLH